MGWSLGKRGKLVCMLEAQNATSILSSVVEGNLFSCTRMEALLFILSNMKYACHLEWIYLFFPHTITWSYERERSTEDNMCISSYGTELPPGLKPSQHPMRVLKLLLAQVVEKGRRTALCLLDYWKWGSDRSLNWAGSPTSHQHSCLIW